jgi:hypothetical protein
MLARGGWDLTLDRETRPRCLKTVLEVSGLVEFRGSDRGWGGFPRIDRNCAPSDRIAQIHPTLSLKETANCISVVQMLTSL